MVSSLAKSIIEKHDDFIQPALSKAWEPIFQYFQGQESSDLQSDQFSEDFLSSLFEIFSRSDFVADTISRNPEWLTNWSLEDLQIIKTEEELESTLRNACTNVSDDSELMHHLRAFRNQSMVRILWRDLLNYATLEETLKEVSSLADVCIKVTADVIYQLMVDRYGIPMSRGDNPVAQELIVLGMGKLGACELNVSSDIDLIFAFPEMGMTNHPSKPIENQQFFTKLGQRFICALDQITADGFVFRVDMRLRPYGQSGSLALNFAAFEDYYQNQGREWERFAMIKSRAITGSEGNIERLMDIINPFVFRKYVDFSSFQALRDMKRLIMSEVHRKGGDHNIKLGEGGIREVEFIAQACQLIYGGRDPSLQNPGLLPIFEELKTQEYLPAEWVDELVAANAFLRNLEHAIQGLADKQTQLIPPTDQERLRVAWSVEKSSWEEVEIELNKHRQNVSRIFQDFLHDPEEETTNNNTAKSNWIHLWQARVERSEWISNLENAGFEDPEYTLKKMEDLISSRQYGVMSADAKARLEQFMPLLLDTVSIYPKPSETFGRIMGLVKSILGRTVYMVLLYENPSALKQLCTLCADSPWVADHLAKSPVILDELLNTQSLYTPPAKEELQDELRQQLLRIPER